VNCNLYDGKEYVWLNGGPPANGLGPDGDYFFAVLEPGGQPDANDGGSKNLSDDFDTIANRTFTVSGGEVDFYGGTHTSNGPLIRLAPYATTSNPGGVYIMAICAVPPPNGSVNPRNCKYDAFKVKEEPVAQVQAILSGMKYKDDLLTGLFGQFDQGEPGLAGWQININCTDGTNATVTTDSNGMWSYATPLHVPTQGTISCDVSETQQSGWSQSGPQFDQSFATGGATVMMNNDLTYTVMIPNDATSTAERLYFGNVREIPEDN
jgi:hypothetical protein